MVKKPVGYKVEDTVLEDFNKKAKDNALNKSQWLENKMKEYLKEGAK
jgi:hypothetical protein